MRARLWQILWISVFGAAFGFVESSVVVYLRSIYYPDGFTFPLRVMGTSHHTLEILREVATIIMLASAGTLAGRLPWERAGYALVAFGVWDIFYYVWLTALLGWPPSWSTPDVLFLIPYPWIAPVLAPLIVSALMITFGIIMVLLIARQYTCHPGPAGWALGGVGVAVVLFTFLADLGASIHHKLPGPYRYEVLAIGLLLCTAGFIVSWRRPLASMVPPR